MRFLLASTMVASLKLWLYLRAVAVECFCSVSHSEAVSKKDGRWKQKEKIVKSGQIHLCVQVSGFRAGVGQDSVARVSLLTADDCET